MCRTRCSSSCSRARCCRSRTAETGSCCWRCCRDGSHAPLSAAAFLPVCPGGRTAGHFRLNLTGVGYSDWHVLSDTSMDFFSADSTSAIRSRQRRHFHPLPSGRGPHPIGRGFTFSSSLRSSAYASATIRQQVPNAMYEYVSEGALLPLTDSGDRYVELAAPRRKPRTAFLPASAFVPAK